MIFLCVLGFGKAVKLESCFVNLLNSVNSVNVVMLANVVLLNNMWRLFLNVEDC